MAKRRIGLAWIWLLFCGHVHASPDVAIVPAWEGLLSANGTEYDRATEVRIGLRAPLGGEARVSVDTPYGEVVTTLDLEAEVATYTTLPLRPGERHALPVRVEIPGGDVIEGEVAVRTTARRLIGVIATGTPRLSGETLPGGDNSEVLPLSPSSAPYYAETYQSLHALIADADGLSGMDDRQLSALLGYLGQCGRMLTLDLGDVARALLNSRAGCGGDSIMHLHNGPLSPEKIRAALGRLSATAVPVLPGATQLKRLAAPTHSIADWRRVAVFVWGHALVLLMLTLSLRRWGWLPAVPVTASVLALLMWSGGAREELTVWAEAHEDHPVARYSALITLHGSGRGNYEIGVPGLFGFPAPVTGEQDSFRGTTRWTVGGSRETGDRVEVDLPVSLMSRSHLALKGTFAIHPRLEISAGNAAVSVRNIGHTRIESGYVLSQDRVFRLPGLEAGERWTAEDAEPVSGSTAFGRLLRFRSRSRAAVLLPLPISSIPVMHTASGNGWLLIEDAASRGNET